LGFFRFGRCCSQLGSGTDAGNIAGGLHAHAREARLAGAAESGKHKASTAIAFLRPRLAHALIVVIPTTKPLAHFVTVTPSTILLKRLTDVVVYGARMGDAANSVVSAVLARRALIIAEALSWQAAVGAVDFDVIVGAPRVRRTIDHKICTGFFCVEVKAGSESICGRVRVCAM